MEALRDLVRDLWSERGRVLFVTTGVVWGTVSLTFLLSFGQAFDTAMNEALELTGTRTLIVDGGATTMPHEGLPAGRPIALTRADVQALRDQVPQVELASCEYSRALPLRASGRTINARVLGVEPEYGAVRAFAPRPGGRFLNANDVRERRRVVFLGWRVKEQLFGGTDAIGQSVRIRGQPFRVIGVMRKKLVLSNYQGLDEDKVCIPASTFHALVGWRFIQHIALRLHRVDADIDALAGVYRVLGARRRFDQRDRGALYVRNMPRQTRTTRDIMDGTNLFLAILGVLSLCVSVLGVANATYAMVEERTREIGVQMAVGARPRTIALRHLGEGLFICAVGGLLGLLISALLLFGINQIPMNERARGYLGQPVVSLEVAITVALLLGAAGAIAGWFPARRAASIQPVEALREQ